ncbi:MAG: eukaryotic-like serine/threonine-protein kinase, partial [Actinomycetota bacterium]|nr:eukaryotic-like serine/threonine-protein kinase [Actinomycetota bacterium]
GSEPEPDTDLERIIARARAAEPSARYQLAAELRDDLRHLDTGDAAAAPTATPVATSAAPITAVAVNVDTNATARATGASPTAVLPVAAAGLAAGVVTPPPRTPVPAARQRRRFRRPKTTYPKVAKAPKPVKPLQPPKPKRRNRRPVVGPPGAPPPKVSRTWKARHWAVIMAAPLLLIVGGAIAYAKLTEHAPIVAVPDVVDRDVFAAAAAMQTSGFEFTPVFVDSPRPGGIILGQQPGNGAKREQGSTITLTVSRTTATVPNVVNLTVDEARAALTRKGLRNLTITPDYRSDVDPGTVMSTAPAAYLKAMKSAPLELVVAADPHVKMRNVVGLDQATATSQLQGDGLQVAVQTANSKSAPAGQVLQARPGADEIVVRGSTVTLTVSSGPKLVAVPPVVGSDRSDAISELEGRGFAVTVTTATTSSSLDGKVLAQDPTGGRAPEGSTVTIAVGMKTPKK